MRQPSDEKLSAPEQDETARLRAALEQERAARLSIEAAYRRSTDESRLLYQAGNLLGSTLELERIYAYLRDLIAGCMDCTGLIVSRFDPDTRLITCSYAWVEGNWLDPATFPAIPLAKEGKGRQSTVIRTGRPLLIPDTDSPHRASTTEYHVDSDGTVREKPLEEKPRTRSLLMVPVKLEGRVLGIVQVQAQRPGAYSEDDLHLVEALILQMAAAERNAFLYNQMKDELAERTRAEGELRVKQAEVQELNQRLRRAMVETHHRVKNNLQVIAAMIDMHLLDDLDSIPRSEIERMGGHIRTLSLVHDLLTRDASEDGYATKLQADEMLTALLDLLRRVSGRIQIVDDLTPAALPVRQATALALIVNELVSNSFKHGREKILVSFARIGVELRLIVSDDGQGFAPGFKPSLQGHTGVDLVEHICRWDLGGSSTYANANSGGAVVTVRFPSPAE